MRSTTSPGKDSVSARERIWTAAFLVAGVLLLSVSLHDRPAPPKISLPHLERVQQAGVLRVATVNDPLTLVFKTEDEPRGFEFDLASRFAQSLGVTVEPVIVTRFGDLFTALEQGRADLVAASVTATDQRRKRVRFGPSYRQVTQEVVYRSGSLRPRSIDDLAGRTISVLAGSSYAETLNALAAEYPGIRFRTSQSGDIETLFEAISEGSLELTVADSNIVDIHQRFYPRIERAFSLTQSQPIAWAFPRKGDDSLLKAAEAFFADAETRSAIERLEHRYFAHLDQFNHINTHYFLRHVDDRLPALVEYFHQAADETGLDWRLLAAMAYQESHWDASAVSPTGVRGLMMLTRATARQMGIENRVDPAQSILGGARYLARVMNKVPDRIGPPDRMWLALAAYNVGYGHLEDARVLTQRRGGNPDKWSDVAANLPLLSDRNWYNQTRYGYARGREPVKYVRNIRSYYDILSWRLSRNDALARRAQAP